MTGAPEQVVDVVVLGVGPGGEYAANRLGRAGLAVVAVDELLYGGECPFFGCTPSKLMIRGADVLAEARRVEGLGGDARVRPDWDTVAGRVSSATSDWHDHVHAERLEKSGVRLVRGRGRLEGPGRVRVTTADGEVVLRARRGIVLNTGTRPAVPSIEGLDFTPYWTNREVVKVEELPESLVVLGGGPIGCELAQTFARFGVETMVLQSAARLMVDEEPEASAVVEAALRADGVDVRTAAEAVSVRHDGAFAVTLADGSVVQSDRLLVATGRHLNLDVGLDTVGLDAGDTAVPTDGLLRVGEGIYAVGDITGHGAYTHVSRYQADIVVRDLLGQSPPEAEYHSVSRVTFTDPELGAVGLTETQARARGIDVRVGTAEIESSSRGWIHGPDTRGVIKVVADAERGILVGATAVAPAGGEVIGLLATAVHARIPITTLRGMHFAYLTFHRAIETALKKI
ncbi:NAD(P)/FAD-dependent oxidoreductase [Nocardioides sp. R-C-SC26]|uniref:dihydrolipoyl dehydrogenase family protein n=1 Tax=Nocardioides sp. R-C-SC26 TaxID=2870414 RepID=UPI001E3CB0F0|nr:NAD(P)/FAD-dependent oxidoreductase [Nocardioides sp. R-C-SC26]